MAATTSDDCDLPCHVSVPTYRRAWATSQDKKAVRFRMDMPGIAKEDVNVFIDCGKLIVRGKCADKTTFANQLENVDEEASILADHVDTYFVEVILPKNMQIEDQVADEKRYAFSDCTDDD